MAAARKFEQVIQNVGASNHGTAARWQLVECGIAPHVIDRRVASGRLRVVRRGVYQVGPLPQPWSPEASAALACGRDARLSHTSAAALHGLTALAAQRGVHVTLPRHRRRRVEGVIIHRVRVMRPDEVVTVEGMPVTTPARTLLDIAELLGARQVEQALAIALRTRLVTLAGVRAMVARHPRHRGARLLRALLGAEDVPAFTRSEAEEKLLRSIRSAGLPRPLVNTMLLGHEVDFLWRSARIVAEVDGFAYHGSARAFAADRRRDAKLAAAGYRVMRFTWADVTERELATVTRLAQALAT